MSLFSLTLSGVKWTSLNSALNSVIQFVRVIILTKLLSVTDYGIMAIVMVITSFSQIFIDAGISSAIIYYKNLPEKVLASLYWLNVFFGFIIFFVLFSLHNILSSYIFDEKSLSEIIKMVAFVFIFFGFASQFSALLKKQLKFQILSKINITSLFIDFIVTLFLAYRGFGVYSLIIGYMLSIITKSLLIIAFGLKIQKPKLYFSLSGLRQYLNFGFFQLTTSVVVNLGNQADKLLIGAFLSAETLGLYYVAKTLIEKPVQFIGQIINQIAFPLYTSIKDNYQLRKWAISAFKTAFLAMTPILLLLIVFPEFVIYNLYGSKWVSAANILSLLSILFSIRLLNISFAPLLLSKGKIKTKFIINLINVLLILCVLGVLLQFSLANAIHGLILLELFVMHTIRFHLIIKPILNLSYKELIKIYFRTLTPLLFSVGVISILYNYLPEEIYNEQILMQITALIILLSSSYFLNIDFINELIDKLKNKHDN